MTITTTTQIESIWFQSTLAQWMSSIVEMFVQNEIMSMTISTHIVPELYITNLPKSVSHSLTEMTKSIQSDTNTYIFLLPQLKDVLYQLFMVGLQNSVRFQCELFIQKIIFDILEPIRTDWLLQLETAIELCVDTVDSSLKVPAESWRDISWTNSFNKKNILSFLNNTSCISEYDWNDSHLRIELLSKLSIALRVIKQSLTIHYAPLNQHTGSVLSIKYLLNTYLNEVTQLFIIMPQSIPFYHPIQSVTFKQIIKQNTSFQYKDASDHWEPIIQLPLVFSQSNLTPNQMIYVHKAVTTHTDSQIIIDDPFKDQVSVFEKQLETCRQLSCSVVSLAEALFVKPISIKEILHSIHCSSKNDIQMKKTSSSSSSSS